MLGGVVYGFDFFFKTKDLMKQGLMVYFLSTFLLVTNLGYLLLSFYLGDSFVAKATSTN